MVRARLRHHGPSASPFELGRTELCHGERLRRARRVREARERLRSALERFEALGAAPGPRGRGRTAGRGRGGRPAAAPATRALTPQELEVALAVTRGRDEPRGRGGAVREPEDDRGAPDADFNKLGVRSRTELAGASPTFVGKSPMAFVTRPAEMMRT